MQDFKSEIKLFLIVAAISAVLAVGGVLLLQVGLGPSSPTPSSPSPTSAPAPSPQPLEDTEGWQTPLETRFLTGQTYRSDEFGFEVKYPPELVKFEYSTFSVYFIPQEYTKEYEAQEGRGLFPRITISTHNFVTIPGDTTRTLIERQSCIFSEPERCPRQITFYGIGDIQDVRINDFEALQFDELNTSGQTQHRHTIIQQREGGLLFDIQNRNVEIGKISQDTYANVLATFRFVEQP